MILGGEIVKQERQPLLSLIKATARKLTKLSDFNDHLRLRVALGFL